MSSLQSGKNEDQKDSGTVSWAVYLSFWKQISSCKTDMHQRHSNTLVVNNVTNIKEITMKI